MADEITSQQQVSIPVQAAPLSVNPQKNILDQTLGDLLQNNLQAQQMITKSMGISQENFQQMVNSAQQNNMMHMKIGDLFKNGIVQQQQVQLTPQQMQQLQNGTLSPQQLLQQAQPVQQKTSFIDKVKSWFK